MVVTMGAIDPPAPLNPVRLSAYVILLDLSRFAAPRLQPLNRQTCPSQQALTFFPLLKHNYLADVLIGPTYHDRPVLGC
jgi:hypothetical protein